MRRAIVLIGLFIGLALGPVQAVAQGGVTLTQEGPAPSAPPTAPSRQGAASSGARPTLVPSPGDPLDVAEVTLPGKPAVVLAGTSSWDEGFDDLKKAFGQIEAELAKAGMRPAGRPVTVFIETDDMGFRYEAMVPVDAAATARPTLSADVGFGRTPEGKAYHFVHKGPYENIDSTYETITAYLDAKGIVAKDVFIEEYVTDLTDRTDDALEINIFVQPR
jgi:effector-binding domain-containing protein